MNLPFCSSNLCCTEVEPKIMEILADLTIGVEAVTQEGLDIDRLSLGDILAKCRTAAAEFKQIINGPVG